MLRQGRRPAELPFVLRFGPPSGWISELVCLCSVPNFQMCFKLRFFPFVVLADKSVNCPPPGPTVKLVFRAQNVFFGTTLLRNTFLELTTTNAQIKQPTTRIYTHI